MCGKNFAKNEKFNNFVAITQRLLLYDKQRDTQIFDLTTIHLRDDCIHRNLLGAIHACLRAILAGSMVQHEQYVAVLYHHSLLCGSHRDTHHKPLADVCTSGPLHDDYIEVSLVAYGRKPRHIAALYRTHRIALLGAWHIIPKRGCACSVLRDTHTRHT